MPFTRINYFINFRRLLDTFFIIASCCILRLGIMKKILQILFIFLGNYRTLISCLISLGIVSFLQFFDFLQRNYCIIVNYL